MMIIRIYIYIYICPANLLHSYWAWPIEIASFPTNTGYFSYIWFLQPGGKWHVVFTKVRARSCAMPSIQWLRLVIFRVVGGVSAVQGGKPGYEVPGYVGISMENPLPSGKHTDISKMAIRCVVLPVRSWFINPIKTYENYSYIMIYLLQTRVKLELCSPT